MFADSEKLCERGSELCILHPAFALPPKDVARNRSLKDVARAAQRQGSVRPEAQGSETCGSASVKPVVTLSDLKGMPAVMSSVAVGGDTSAGATAAIGSTTRRLLLLRHGQAL